MEEGEGGGAEDGALVGRGGGAGRGDEGEGAAALGVEPQGGAAEAEIIGEGEGAVGHVAAKWVRKDARHRYGMDCGGCVGPSDLLWCANVAVDRLACVTWALSRCRSQ